MNLSELLAYQSRKYPQKEGLITPDARLDYKEWNFKVNQFAHALQRLGIHPADKVMIHMPNTIEFAISYFAVHRIGAIAVPVNARLIANELSYIFDHSDTTFFLTHELLFEQVAKLAHEKKGTFIKTGSATDYWLSFEELMSQESGKEILNTVEEDTEASILYTSGTTGEPKGVVFTHRNILTVARMMAVEMEMKPDSRILHMMPLSHSAPLHLFMAAGIYVGATHILAPSFSPELLLKLASSERSTHFFGAPVAYLLTAKHPKVTETDLSWMKCWVYGGAPLSRREVQFIQEQLDTEQLYCVYGLTEAGPNGALLLPLEHDDKAGSIGQRAALNCEMKVVDDQGNEAGIDEVGEIILRGEGTMRGYYKDEGKTKEVLKDGWLYTGDMALRDQDGFYWVIDRKKDIIISGGSNVYPREIEEALIRHPHVQDAAVVGVPHPDWGETVKAFIVQDGTINRLAEDCREYLRQDLADYKIPKLYEEVRELPRNATGKLMKNQLRDQIHTR
ncbi:class I adenylate-forming enzyme family protein [Halobacillus halophilus]|uniref:class I adenylate-forming enzyme family protein n=1 Tax=Halobacillus halophilus TaxID=1570 RepID=UPI001CD49A08|nr:long-chain-fatty-acid--CoA ligase [Halobacillus halophilus]MCA1011198.1 long-chain-fatty-acid--CoA ligase [Halobacillus halophilus]